MYVKRLSLYGFKSFALETTVDFYEGVTVVLGPNGIGKSNIVEAFLWVLGEQSNTRLRLDTSRGLESVIFHGTDTRKPSSLAEVTLTLDNKSKWLKGYEQDIVTVTRKYYRKGLSEYYINEEVVRLRDIVDMFLDTGLGKNAYSVIKQGMVDKIAQQKPEDRRALIEDAAGISKYLERRREATRKLEESERNLMTVKIDIRNAEKNYKALKDQAARTERHQELTDEKKKINITLSVNQVKKARTILEEQTKELEELSKKRTELEQELQELDNKKRDELLRFEQTRTLSVELEKQVGIISSELNHAGFILKDLDTKSFNILKDKEEAVERKNSLSKKLEDNKEQIATFETEIKKIIESIKNSKIEQEKEQTKIAEEQNKIATYNDTIAKLSELNNKAHNDISEVRVRQHEIINKIITEIDDKKRDVLSMPFYQNIDKHEQDIDIGFKNLLDAINKKMTSITEFEYNGSLETMNELSYSTLVGFIKELKENLETEKRDTLLLFDIFKEYNQIKDPFMELLFNKEGTYTKKENIDKEIEALEEKVKRNNEDVEITNSNIKFSNEIITSSNSRLTTLTVEQARFEGARHTLEEKKSMVFSGLKSLEEEIKKLTEKIDRLDTEHKGLSENIKKQKEIFKELEDKKARTEKDAKNKANEIKNSESAITNVEANLAKRIKRLNEVNEAFTRITERINQSRDKIKDVYEHFYENYAIKLDDFEAQAPDNVDEPALRIKLENVINKIKALGHINEMALDEYQEAKSRYEFLIKQKEDLEKSKEEILNIIEEANKKAIIDFLDTFNEINKRFEGTFKTLFGGGKAGLVIQNPDDILNSPIDIIAQPPGKKMENIVAYSGGELAMTGLALVFAIFLYRPSPFCILDEVDAALDGANIIRYKNMVKELSNKTQFLLITHDEVSATIADTYYGVTAEEKGISKVFTVKVDKDGSVNGSEKNIIENKSN